MPSQQANLYAPLPVFAEQRADLLEDFRIELRRGRESVGTRQRGEVFVSQLELNSAGVEVGLAQAASNHFRQAHQSGLDLGGVRGVFVVSVLVTDRLGFGVGSNFAIEPPARIFATRLSRQRETPLAEALIEFRFFQAREIAYLPDSERVEIALHDLADAGNRPHIEGSQKLR